MVKSADAFSGPNRHSLQEHLENRCRAVDFDAHRADRTRARCCETDATISALESLVSVPVVTISFGARMSALSDHRESPLKRQNSRDRIRRLREIQALIPSGFLSRELLTQLAALSHNTRIIRGSSDTCGHNQTEKMLIATKKMRCQQHSYEALPRIPNRVRPRIAERIAVESSLCVVVSTPISEISLSVSDRKITASNSCSTTFDR